MSNIKKPNKNHSCQINLTIPAIVVFAIPGIILTILGAVNDSTIKLGFGIAFLCAAVLSIILAIVFVILSKRFLKNISTDLQDIMNSLENIFPDSELNTEEEIIETTAEDITDKK